LFSGLILKKTKIPFIDLKGNVNSGKAAKFLLRFSYFYDSFSQPREEGVLSGYYGFS
jgi:hypothetical protein